MKLRTLLLFIPALLSILMSCDNASIFTPSLDGRDLEKLKLPGESDFYILSADGRTKFTVKVDAFSADSIDFRYLTDHPGTTGDENHVGELLLNRKPTTTHRVAKADIKVSKYDRRTNDNLPGKIILPGLNNGEPLLVYHINRFASLDDIKIFAKDTLVEQAVANIVDVLALPLSTEETISLIDSNSLLYFDTLLAVATAEDPNEMLQYIQNATYPEAEYGILLYTKYVFLDSYNGVLPNASQLLDQFISLYRLVSPGMWSQDFMGKELYTESVYLTGLSTSVATFATSSNIIVQ